MLIQKLRLKRGWSQQQLAELSGLSVRTIQRIEGGQVASLETQKSLAAVFEIDLTDLQGEPNMASPTINASEKQEAQAFIYVRKLKDFYLHLFKYVLICTVLGAINLTLTPDHLWAYWVIGGWGLGILGHAFRVFGHDWLLGPEWERRQVEKRLGRPI